MVHARNNSLKSSCREPYLEMPQRLPGRGWLSRVYVVGRATTSGHRALQPTEWYLKVRAPRGRKVGRGDPKLAITQASLGRAGDDYRPSTGFREPRWEIVQATGLNHQHLVTSWGGFGLPTA